MGRLDTCPWGHECPAMCAVDLYYRCVGTMTPGDQYILRSDSIVRQVAVGSPPFSCGQELDEERRERSETKAVVRSDEGDDDDDISQQRLTFAYRPQT